MTNHTRTASVVHALGWASIILSLSSGCSSDTLAQSEQPASCGCPGSVEHLNPEGLAKSPAYSQAIAFKGGNKTIYVGGQNAVDASGTLVGPGDLGAQAAQVFRNVETALGAGGARIEHVVKWTLYLVQGQPVEQAFAAYQQAWANRGAPATISAVYVAGLTVPGALIELEAVAVVPERAP